MRSAGFASALAYAVAFCAWAICHSAAAQDQSSPKPAEPEKKQAAVMPVCAACHERQTQSIVFTAHGAMNDAQGSMCQACHGDASEHLKDPSKKPPNPFSSVTPANAHDQSGVCLNCHVGNR